MARPQADTTHLLAQSRHYKVWHEYETVYLELESSERVIIGDFYGDPNGALIDWAERWCLVYGEHLLLYHLKPPFLPWDTSLSNAPEQYMKLFEGWNFENTYQTADDVVRLVADVWGDRAGLYELELANLHIRQLLYARKGS